MGGSSSANRQIKYIRLSLPRPMQYELFEKLTVQINILHTFPFPVCKQIVHRSTKLHLSAMLIKNLHLCNVLNPKD